MKMGRIGVALALLLAALGLRAQESPAPGQGGRHGGPPPGFHLLPRFAVDRLNLTEDQQSKIAELEKETKAKLAQILTPEQMKTLEELRPPRPMGGQGGPGDAGGQPNPRPSGN
jgi:Spy/CpxP family protein refolding chaperone